MCLLSFRSEGSYGGEDSFMHYLFARYAPAHPKLFLDHWGKPLFTMLSAPFATFGFQGIKIFNILCATAVAWFGYRIAYTLNWERAWLAIPLIQFNALFFVTGISGLTEPLFALVLCGSVLLFLKEKFYASCLVLSFLPFVRSEGNLMILFWGAMLLMDKKWKPIPLLIVGTAVFSLIGGYLKDDFFWLRTENPYQGAEDIYGKGEWLHFVRANREIFGVPQSIMVVVGGIALLQQALLKGKWKTLALLAGPFLVYFGAHTLFWKFGLFGSFGLIRVMAAVVPLSSVIALAGINYAAKLLPVQNKLVKEGLIAIPMVFAVYDPFFQYPLPYPLDDRQQLMQQVAHWIPREKYTRVFAAHPYFFHAAEIDIFDSNIRKPLEACMQEDLSSSDLIIWDNQFGPNESGMKEGWQDSLPIRKLATLRKGVSIVELYRMRSF